VRTKIYGNNILYNIARTVAQNTSKIAHRQIYLKIEEA